MTACQQFFSFLEPIITGALGFSIMVFLGILCHKLMGYNR